MVAEQLTNTLWIFVPSNIDDQDWRVNAVEDRMRIGYGISSLERNLFHWRSVVIPLGSEATLTAHDFPRRLAQRGQ